MQLNLRTIWAKGHKGELMYHITSNLRCTFLTFFRNEN